MVEPEVQAVEEMKPCPIEQWVPFALISRAKENGRRKDALEAFHDAAISFSVFEQPEEVQHLSGGAKVDGPAPLPQSQSCDPDGNEPILAKRQAEPRVPRDLEEELAVSSCV